ncbi:aspartate aminotransferase family protein [Azospirillum halopraeferens]|uniref:class-III pyridoxal-phosphate-dependent aminotransferase n=1 Tax=Azospirillum halopraeferens TaxID=34010 RepID=UPI0004043E7C|nr:aminotransferase class III-fold pyridoxal phosphate-dependent enzyme [Azospirillum halopraeferens]
MHDYGFFSYGSKQEMIEKSIAYWNPDKTRFWQQLGVDLVIDRREGYFLYDMDGARLIDVHLNGGTYNLGHRHPELVATLKQALDHFDMGNHHFPSLARTAFAERLARTVPWARCYTLFAAAGGEAVDLALKTARAATGRRKIVSIVKGYHGHTGLAVCTGDERFSRRFLSERPAEFVQVPFNDLEAMEAALAGDDAAAVILETIPATYGFPLPAEGYLQGVKALCEAHGTLYIADEVQTGLMRCGTLWGYEGYGIVPDLVVSAKGIGGGLYPIAVVMVRGEAAGWLEEDGFAHMSTAGGAELGCIVGMAVLEMTQRPDVVANVHAATRHFSDGLADIRSRHGDFFAGVRQRGLVMGLEFAHPEGAKFVSRALYENGVWAIFSTLDPQVLQFKPGILIEPALRNEVLERLEAALPRARQLAAEAKRAA